MLFLVLGLSYVLSLIFGIACVSCSALFMDGTQPTLKTLPNAISKCKRNSYAAFQLCMDKLAKTEAERRECARLYVTTFPRCYFKKGKGSLREIFDSYAKCVMDSVSFGETYACDNTKNQKLAEIDSGRNDENGDLKDTNLEKRSNVQQCNTCRNTFDICTHTSVSEDAHVVCIVNRTFCFAAHNCL